MKIPMNIVKYSILLLVGLLLIISLLPLLLGYEQYVIRSGSMGSSIPKGSVVYLQKTSFSKIEIDDVVAYQHDMQIIVHRVSEIDKEHQQLRSKGDSNLAQDQYYVHDSAVIGKVICSIPFLGYILYFFRSIPGIIILLFLLALLMAIIRCQRKPQGE